MTDEYEVARQVMNGMVEQFDREATDAEIRYAMSKFDSEMWAELMEMSADEQYAMGAGNDGVDCDCDLYIKLDFLWNDMFEVIK